MKVQRAIVATTLGIGLLLVGCDQQPPAPSDTPNILAVQAPATVSPNRPFDVDVYGIDLGGTDYAVIFHDAKRPAHVTVGAGHALPDDVPFNPDGYWCEYGAYPLTATRSSDQFTWTGGKGKRLTSLLRDAVLRVGPVLRAVRDEDHHDLIAGCVAALCATGSIRRCAGRSPSRPETGR